MAKVHDSATDLVTFARSSSGTALRRVGYGENLVTDFSTYADQAAFDVDWTRGTGWTFDANNDTAIHAAGSATLLTQSISMTLGKVYQATCDVVACSGGTGSLQFRSGGTTTSATIDVTDVGSSVQVTYVAEGNTQVGVYAGSGTDLTIDNVSVKEVIFDRATDPLVLYNHPDDIPRIEYGSDGELKGMLIEEQRTNLLTHSVPDSTNWSLTNSPTVTVDDAVSPDGNTNATALLSNGTTLAQQIVKTGLTLADNTDYSLSVFYKAAVGSSGVRIALTNKANSTVFFSALSDGTKGPADASNTQIDDMGAGWYRASCVVNSSSGATAPSMRLYVTDSAGEIFGTQVDGDGIYVYGAQLEEGSFPTSYIPTAGNQKTRDPDIASIPVSAFGYNQTAGTVVVDFDMLSDNAGTNDLTQAAFGFHDGTSNNRLELFSASAGTLTLRDRTASANYDATSTGNSLEQSTKSAASYASGEASKLVVNGGTASVAGTATTPPAYSTLLLGDTQNVKAELNGHIKSIQYYPRRLTDAQLQELTA